MAAEKVASSEVLTLSGFYETAVGIKGILRFFLLLGFLLTSLLIVLRQTCSLLPQ